MTGSDVDQVRFCLVRLDDRLLHGQVVVNWVRSLWPQRIAIVAEDHTGSLEGRAILYAVAPEGVRLWVGSVAEAPEALLRGDTPPATTVVLLPSPTVVTALYDAGVRYAALNLGCLGQASGRVRVAPQISLSPEEAEALQYLASLGVVVTAQALPGDAPIALDALVRRLTRSRGRSVSA